jgi:hypothetical protein
MNYKQFFFLCICAILLVACQHRSTPTHGKEPSYVHDYNILRNFIGTEPIPDNWILQERVWGNECLLEVWQRPDIPLSSPYNGYILSKPLYVAKQLFFLNGRLWEEKDFYFSNERYVEDISRTPVCSNKIIEPRLHPELVNKRLRKSYFYFIAPDYNNPKHSYCYSGKKSSSDFINKKQCDSILYNWKLLSYGSISLVK